MALSPTCLPQFFAVYLIHSPETNLEEPHMPCVDALLLRNIRA